MDKLDYVASRNNLKEALAHPNFKVPRTFSAFPSKTLQSVRTALGKLLCMAEAIVDCAVHQG